ncbi:MAG TPA: DUF1499 domain-containing protein [Rhizomicrobium sp.]|jgi:hypothetical protein|nr:DUF1499 domain-containing protein [Rhizomicrobium sp.]
MRFQLLAARLAFAGLGLAVLTAAAAVAGVRLGMLSDAGASALMIPATILGAVALVLALLWLRAALASNQGAGKRLGLTALIGALVFLYQPLSYVYAGFVSLPIHDATTDPEDPPQFAALAKIHPANSRVFDGERHFRYKGEDVTVAYALHDKYPLLTKPHKGLLVLPGKAYWRAYGVVQGLGWTIVDANEKDLRIEATSRSFWFGRISDIVIRVRQAGAIGSWVDVRSESREGGDDHGRNVARLKTFFAYFKL